MIRRLLSLSALLLAAGSLSAQDAPFHANLRDTYDVAGDTYSDVWGRGNNAFMGRFGQNEIDIINVTNPDNVSLRATIVVPSPNNGCSAQDVKVGVSPFDPSKRLAIIAFEASGPDAFGIYDVSVAASPVLLTRVQPGFYATSHNTSYREDGWVATCNSATSDLAIIDLRSYDPNNAPATITSATYQLNSLGSAFVHDVTLTTDYLFVSQWSSLLVYDASNLAGGPPIYLGEIPGYSNHAVFPTSDGEYVVTTDERSGGAARLYQFVDDGGPIELRACDSWVPPTAGLNAAFSVHNPVFAGDRCYVSSYNAGALVFQIDRTTSTFEKVASYDSSTVAPAGFDGCWGVFPGLGVDKVLMSDLQNGLSVVDFSALQFVSQDPRPRIVAPFATTTIQVDIEELGSISLDAGTPMLFTSVNGAAFSGSSMVNVGGNTWEGTLPAMDCDRKVDYYFAADSSGGETFTAPAEAPTNVYTAWATLSLTPIFVDDFNGDKGWTVTNTSVTTGAWERATPASNGLAPHADDWRDSGGLCFVTANDAGGGNVGTSDLDGGPTIVTSPVLNFSAADGLISYSGWQASNTASSTDALICQISNGGPWIEAVSQSGQAGGWVRHCFRVSDFVGPNSNVRVRFLISDNPNDSVTEGAIDNFTAEQFCRSPLATATFRNGTGVNNSCYSSTPPVLGQNWVSTVTHSGHPGAVSTVIVLYTGASTGPIVAGGELLVNLGSQKLFVSVGPAAGVADTHTQSIPADTSFAGVAIVTQGAILGGGYELCNAYDIVVGF